MEISGWIKQSLMDFTGQIASVIFTQGCNLKCPYCHNHELWAMGKGQFSEQEILTHLNRNKQFIDGVVITGGEPCLQKDLPEFLQKLKQEQLLVKLDTNGTKPEVLGQLLKQQLIDYIAMDIKSELSCSEYSRNCGIKISTQQLQNIRQSIQIIQQSGVGYEFRTTICRELISPQNLQKLCSEIQPAQSYYLQAFHQNPKTNQNLFSSYSLSELEKIQSQLKGVRALVRT